MKTQAVTKSDVYSRGLKYAMNLDNQSYSVVGIGTCKDADIIIPTTHHNLPVTSIGVYAFYDCKGLTSIVLSNSITSIGQCAFDDCTGLHKNGMFKATDKDMCCRQFQYNLGEKFETTHASLCHSGFHFCTNAFDLLNYYSGEIGRTVRFFEVKVDKVAEERDFDSKRVCKEITFLREIKSYAELLN